MGNRIKLPDTDFAKVGDDVSKVAKDVARFVRNHKDKFLSCGLLLVVVDSIRMHFGQKALEESFVKQQKVARKHVAEISALRAEAEQSHKGNRRVGQLEQIVKKITEGGGSE